MVIYLIHNTVNGKYYVGKTTKPLAQRWSQHKYSAKNGSMTHLHCAIRKDGADKFVISPIMSTLITEEQLNEQEQFLISLFKASDPKYGYNLTSGGDGFSHNALTRKKISEAKKGKPLSERNRLALKGVKKKVPSCKKGTHLTPEHIEKVKVGRRGATMPPCSETTKQKISNSLKGHPVSVETREKLRNAALRQHRQEQQHE